MEDILNSNIYNMATLAAVVITIVGAFVWTTVRAIRFVTAMKLKIRNEIEAFNSMEVRLTDLLGGAGTQLKRLDAYIFLSSIERRANIEAQKIGNRITTKYVVNGLACVGCFSLLNFIINFSDLFIGLSSLANEFDGLETISLLKGGIRILPLISVLFLVEAFVFGLRASWVQAKFERFGSTVHGSVMEGMRMHAGDELTEDVDTFLK